MAAGAFNLIGGKSLRVAYVYSLVVLSLMTPIMPVRFQRRLELIALANIAMDALWAYSFPIFDHNPPRHERFSCLLKLCIHH
jgi:hypothetical protein